nr:MAG TPA: hypothetical protein [Bacteriophage sp.]
MGTTHTILSRCLCMLMKTISLTIELIRLEP